MSDDYVNRLFSSGALDGKIEALQSQIKALLQLRAMDAAELEALRADASMLRELLEMAAEYTRHSDYDWDIGFARDVAAAIEARKGAA